MIIDYTTYNDIRAALGVSEEDLPDEILDLKLYNDLLTQDFESIDLTVESSYGTTKGISTPTAAEFRFISSCDLFATYSVARQLTATLPLFAAKSVSDGKAQVSRFDAPYKDVIATVLGQYEKAKTRLISAFAGVGTTVAPTATKAYFSVVSPGTDPVTGL